MGGVMGELRELLKENKKVKTVYLVRGMLLALSAKMETGGDDVADTKAGVRAAVPMEVSGTPAAPAAGTVIGDAERSKTRQRATGFSGTAMGTSVFGVEYWECKVRRQGGLKALYQRRKEDDLVFGEAMEPRNEHFGAPERKRKMILRIARRRTLLWVGVLNSCCVVFWTNFPAKRVARIAPLTLLPRTSRNQQQQQQQQQQ